MAIKKIKQPSKAHAKAVPHSPHLETKRKAFRQHLSNHAAGLKHDGSKHPSHHTPRRRTMIVAIAAVLIILGSFAVVCLYFWTQSPQRVVTDAVLNTLSARTLTYTSSLTLGESAPGMINGSFANGNSQFTANIHTELGDVAGVPTTVMTTPKGIYIKMSNVSTLIQRIVPRGGADPQQIITSVQQQVDGKWILLNQADARELLPPGDIAACVVGFVQNIAASQTARTMVMNSYESYPFFTITQTGQSGSFNGDYDLSINATQLDHFMKTISTQKTTIPTECKSITNMSSAQLSDLMLHLQIDKASRSITRLDIRTQHAPKTTLTIKPAINQDITLHEPVDAVPFDTISSPLFKQYLISAMQQTENTASFVIANG